MEFNKEQLETIEALAKTFFTIHEVAVILQLDILDFKLEMKNQNSKAYLAYYKGFYEQKRELQKSIIDLALRGSSPAQAQALRFLDSASNQNE